MELPVELQGCLDTELSSIPGKKLASLTAALSNRYRTGVLRSGEQFVQSRAEVAAYAAFRMPATYAAVHAAMQHVRDRLPEWRPSTLLDAGAGPGTAMWAALRVWPELADVMLLERDGTMAELGKKFAEASPDAPIRNATWQSADLMGAWQAPQHSLVVASYVLGELPAHLMAPTVIRLWENTTGVLLLVEPGTPAGFERIRAARDTLLIAGGMVSAPCPHTNNCPMPPGEWCHFAQRVGRTRLHRQLKSGELPYEDEKYSYMAVSRVPGTPISGRIVRHPQLRPGHTLLQVCTAQGVETRTVTKKDGDLFRLARGAGWGAAIETGAPQH